MADVTTGTSAVLRGGATTDGIAGAAIAANQSVYLDTTQTPPKWELADADAVASAGRDGLGIALNAAADGGHLRVAVSEGELTMSGATLVVGQAYVVSATAGGIAPYSDLLSGDYVSILGVASAATKLKLNIWATGVAKA